VFPAWDRDHGAAPVDELVTGGSTAQEVAEVWEGDGTVEFLPSPVDELADLAPVDMGRAYRFSYAETLNGGRAIEPR
jgi:hypothetical protein